MDSTFGGSGVNYGDKVSILYNDKYVNAIVYNVVDQVIIVINENFIVARHKIGTLVPDNNLKINLDKN